MNKGSTIVTGFVLYVIVLTTAVVRSDNADGSDVTPEAIFKKSLETYASLKSYSDEGVTVTNIGGKTYTLPFRIKMARPNLYRIQNQDYRRPSGKMDLFWSNGQGNFSEQGLGVINANDKVSDISDTQEQTSQETLGRELNLTSAAYIGYIPGIFFNDLPDLSLLARASLNVRQADEKVRGVDCYVFLLRRFGSRTVWIGKKDFLVHQWRLVSSKDDQQAGLDIVYKNMLARPPPKRFPFIDVDNTETHDNIILNPELSPADFK